ncbi:hypothetical protein MMC16_000215, partial [Acarospora aff. strigata]|nr:hypothetical protein [Acarospora aff. strigata]
MSGSHMLHAHVFLENLFSHPRLGSLPQHRAGSDTAQQEELMLLTRERKKLVQVAGGGIR